MTHEQYYSQLVDRINQALQQCFPKQSVPQETLFDAMRYSLLAGGKRIRPVFLLEFCKACGGDAESAFPFACAIEMIHTYSLIHDDLPCMDDDDLRRGRPTSHKVFGEAAAVLAGDALLNAAYETMLGAAFHNGPSVRASLHADRVLEATRVIAHASGSFGMVGGQILDMENESAEKHDPSDSSNSVFERIELTDRLKTGALISAACEAGCVLAGADSSKRKAAVEFAQALGLAFQIKDDLLDLTGTEEALGKKIGMDENRNKMTYVKALGIEACKQLVDEKTEAAKQALSCFDHNEFILWFSDYLAARQH